MKKNLSRRDFIKSSTVAGAGVGVGVGWTAANTAPTIRAGQGSPGKKIVVGVMGLQRGMAHVRNYMDLPDAEIAYVCDVDDQRSASAGRIIAEKQARSVKIVRDFRRILDDPDVDALSIATPNHWHAPATILACAAGKHVYVEKPGSHNPKEGELMTAAARKYDRRVQMGNQRRSYPVIQEAIQRLREGAIGKVLAARCWYANARESIGHAEPSAPPDHLDYLLWQGPAPERPYRSNLVHYNWHWRWHWGNGEIGNNGVHSLDIARWGLNVDYPSTITCTGGRYHHSDDQETPDTAVASFHFGNQFVTWDGSSCHPRRAEALAFVRFYGESGSMAIINDGYHIFDPNGTQVEVQDGPRGEKRHFNNFLAAIRGEEALNSEIGDGQKSTLLCHLGNIAYRLGRTIDFNTEARRIDDDGQANSLWSRDYRPGWAPIV